MNLSEKQQEYLTSCDHRWNLKCGATGSGKTYLDFTVVIPQRLLALKGEGAVLFCGYTQGSLDKNILSPMREIYGENLVGKIVGKTNTAKIFGRSVICLGADKVTAVNRIRGLTLEYLYCDEVSTFHPEVFEMLKSRLRCVHSHCDMTCNPGDPSNFVKLFIDKAGQPDSGIDLFTQTSTIDDNPFYPEDAKESLKAEYAGTVFYQRYILGEWARAEGLIYRQIADALQSGDSRFIDKDTRQFSEINIGVDFGGSGSWHAFVATGMTPKGGIVALASERIKPDGDAEALCRSLYDFCVSVFSKYRHITAIYCDSAEQVLITTIRGHFSKRKMNWMSEVVYNAKKIPILDRIRLTSALIGSGRFHYVKESCKSLETALSTAVWTDKTEGQPDTRLDNGTSDIDSLDAFEYTIERQYKRLLGE